MLIGIVSNSVDDIEAFFQRAVLTHPGQEIVMESLTLTADRLTVTIGSWPDRLVPWHVGMHRTRIVKN